MDVRQVRPTDAPLVLALALDEGLQLVRNTSWPCLNSMPRTLLQAALPLALPGRTWIARDGANVAVLEIQPRQYVIGWDIARLAVRGDMELVLPAAMRAAIAYLQSKGVPRLFARCHDEGRAALQAIGFLPLAREYVLVGSELHSSGDSPLPIDSRYRRPQDAWPLHRLEHEITPSLVRQLEGLTSLDWAGRSRHMAEIVVERDDCIVAWIGWSTKPQHGFVQLGMLVDPAHKELGPDLLQHALQQVPRGSRLVTRVREYQVETLNACLEAGFQVVSEETLMVKHAQVELAPAVKRRMRVVKVPSMQTFPITLDRKSLRRVGGEDTAS